MRKEKKITVEWTAAMLATEMWSSSGVKGVEAALGQGLFLGTPDLRFLKFDANPSTVTGARKNGSWNRRWTRVAMANTMGGPRRFV